MTDDPLTFAQAHWQFLTLLAGAVTHLAHQAWAFWKTVGGLDGLQNFYHMGKISGEARPANGQLKTTAGVCQTAGSEREAEAGK